MKKVKAKMTLDKLAEVMMDGFKKTDISLAELKETMDELAISTGKGFRDVDEKFDAVDKRFDKVDSTLEHKTAELSSRLTSVESRTRVLEDK